MMTSLLKDNSPLVAHISLSGTPKPARLGKTHRGKIYNAREAFMDAQKWLIKQQYRSAPYLGPVEIRYYFGFPIPKSWPQAKKEKAEIVGMKHTTKPDYDNLEKLYNDCIKKIVIEDDCQVVKSSSSKEYTTVPRTEIWVYHAD